MTSPDSYHATRSRAGLVDRSARGLLAVTGRDRASYLQGLLTNDVMLEPGQGRYAAYLTAQGRMIADMRVVELGDRMLLDLHAAVAGPTRERLEQSVFTEDVQVIELGGTWTSFGVHGPEAFRLVARALDGGGDLETALAGLAEHHAVTARVDGAPVIVVASRDLGLPGFDLYTERSGGTALRDVLLAAGAAPLDAATRDVLRIEAGRPEFTVDMNEETIPLEAGLEDRAISLTKGCYVGQEVIIRVLHRGQGRVARRLVGLQVEPAAGADPPLPSHGDAIVVGGRTVGEVTSAARSPVLGGPIALGYVHRDFTAPGTPVVIRTESGEAAAAVRALGEWGQRGKGIKG